MIKIFSIVFFFFFLRWMSSVDGVEIWCLDSLLFSQSGNKIASFFYFSSTLLKVCCSSVMKIDWTEERTSVTLYRRVALFLHTDCCFISLLLLLTWWIKHRKFSHSGMILYTLPCCKLKKTQTSFISSVCVQSQKLFFRSLLTENNSTHEPTDRTSKTKRSSCGLLLCCKYKYVLYVSTREIHVFTPPGDDAVHATIVS